MQQHPIPPATDPLQYRAIGIVKGTYVPKDEDNFTRGVLIDSGGESIDAVVLGRVISLMRRYVSLESPHLWVVYPRSRQADNLHLQISGIWEPSTLMKESTSSETMEAAEGPLVSEIDELKEGDNYFSIRGELIFTKNESGEVIVKVRQKPRNNSKKNHSFKLFLHGEVPMEHLRNFISFNVRREGQQLHIEDYEVVGSMPRHKDKRHS